MDDNLDGEGTSVRFAVAYLGFDPCGFGECEKCEEACERLFRQRLSYLDSFFCGKCILECYLSLYGARGDT